jgi:hypothetical protein
VGGIGISYTLGVRIVVQFGAPYLCDVQITIRTTQLLEILIQGGEGMRSAIFFFFLVGLSYTHKCI